MTTSQRWVIAFSSSSSSCCFLVSLLLLVVVLCCNNNNFVTAQSGGDGTMFSYDPGAWNGPSQWGNLDIPGNQCNGQRQSGIDIVTQGKACDVMDGFHSQPGDCTMADLLFAIDPNTANIFVNIANCQAPSYTIHDGFNNTDDPTVYSLFHVNFHAGSEHSIDGQFADAEIQFVHTTNTASTTTITADSAGTYNNGYGIISVLVQRDDNMGDHPMIEFILDQFTRTMYHNDSTMCPTTAYRNNDGNNNNIMQHNANNNNNYNMMDKAAFLPYQSLIPFGGTSFVEYSGSFTEPPCHEIVTYVVAENVLRVSPRQADRLRGLVLDWHNPRDNCLPGTIAHDGSTARPVQPLNGRTTRRICSSSSPTDESTIGTDSMNGDDDKINNTENDSSSNRIGSLNNRYCFVAGPMLLFFLWMVL